MFKTPILMLKMKFFWLIFRGKFEQKTQKSIFLKNQWRLKNIKKAMVVKNIIAEDMPFTKSIFEQFWRSYCKKTIFVVFHFLKFLPTTKGLGIRPPRPTTLTRPFRTSWKNPENIQRTSREHLEKIWRKSNIQH